MPANDTTLGSLKLLTTQQALADIIYFKNWFSTKYGLSSKNKWVSFGGSYAGMLSAWLRGKYPNDFYAAYSSSAPIEAKVNFFEYLEVVAAALKNVSVECLQSTTTAVKLMKPLTNTVPGLASLSQYFRFAFLIKQTFN
jgi:hypothetical protein